MDTLLNRQLAKFLFTFFISVSCNSVSAGLIGRDLDTNTAGFEAYYDNVLDITWLADVNYAQTSGYVTTNNFGWLSHSEALTWADQLSIGGYDNWRLPTTGIADPTSNTIGNARADGTGVHGFNLTSPSSELSHLFYVTLGNTGRYDLASNETGCGAFNGTPSCFVNTGPFTNLDNTSLFWYAEERNAANQSSWIFSTYNGVQSWSASSFGTAWAVADGDIAGNTTVAVNAPSTFILSLFGLIALVAARGKR